MINEDTIAAVATAPGEGGIGIVRISGELAETILRSVFIPANKKHDIENRKLTYGNVVSPKDGEIIDEAMAVIMKGPYSYTREDVVEINCHGSMVSLRRTLEAVLASGARLAEPGEFTKRAFLNGRIDLSQAEAVIDLIRAKTDVSYQAALGQLSGRLSGKISEIRSKLVDVLVDLTVNIDYPDEDIEIMTYEKIRTQMTVIRDDIRGLTDTGHTGKILREGLNTVIAGKPNVGKSSLMNALLREQRSIVTEIPGTTRDTIEEQLDIGGILLNIKDTAGIRSTDDTVERIGVERSLDSLRRADLILLLLDISRPLDSEDMEIIDEIKDLQDHTVVILNKTDRQACFKEEDIIEHIQGIKVIRTSMLEGSGITELEDIIKSMVYGGQVKNTENVLITNVRHSDLLNKALTASEDALNGIDEEQPLELVEIDVNAAWALLGEITGEAVQEDIINEVFSRFCLGK